MKNEKAMHLILQSTGEALDLGQQAELSVQLGNPFFREESSYSLPMVLPATPRNRRLLGHMQRPDMTGMPALSCRVELHSLQLAATLRLTAFSDEGFEAALTFADFDLMKRAAELRLPDAMAGLTYEAGNGISGIRGLYAAATRQAILHDEDIPWEWFPVFTPDGVLNQVCKGDVDNWWVAVDEREDHDRVVYKPATATDNNSARPEYDADPANHLGNTVFLRLEYVLRRVISQLGYDLTLTTPAFLSASEQADFAAQWKRLVLLNNTCDAFCPGKIYYDTLVPDISCAELLQAVETMLGMHFMVSGNEVRMVFTGDIISTLTPQRELLQEQWTVEYQPLRNLAVSCEHLSDDGTANTAERAPQPALAIRSNTASGRHRPELPQQDDWTGDAGLQSETLELPLADTCMVRCRTAVSGSAVTAATYQAPYLPGWRQLTTTTTADGSDQTRSAALPLVLCYAYGYDYHGAQHLVPYGSPCCSTPWLTLYPTALCKRMLTPYDNALQQGMHRYGVQLMLPPADILQLDFARPVTFRGRRCLIRSVSFAVSDGQTKVLADFTLEGI